MSGDRALLYCRVSTDPQERDGTSLETQEQACRAYARRQGWQVAHVVTDTASGYSLKRPGLTRVRALLADVDVLLVYDFDRASREQTHMGVLLYDLVESGTALHSVQDGAFDNTPIGKFMLSAHTFAAEVERAKIAERTMRGKVAWAERGRYIGPAPYGYTKCEDGTLAEDPDRARVVRRIFDLYLDDHLGHRAISVLLTDEHVPTPRGAESWSQAMVRLILQREVYVGEGEWNGIAVSVPPIIERERWEAAQARRRQRATVGAGPGFRSPNLLTGVLYCGACQGRMQVDTTRVRDGERTYSYRWYICARWHRGHGCVSNRHDADPLEARTLELLARSHTVIPARTDRHSHLDTLRADLAHTVAQIADESRKRAAIRASIAAGDLFGQSAREAVQEREDAHERLEAESRRLSLAVAEAERIEATERNRPQAVVRILEQSEPAAKKATLQAHVRRIVVYPGDPEPEVQ